MFGKMTTVFDSDLYSLLFTNEHIRQIWSDENLIRCLLRFEINVAKVQAGLGIIPEKASEEISKACLSLNVDWEILAEKIRENGMPVKPLLEQITANQSPLVSKYLHWGCTTQDLLDSSLAMRIKQTLFTLNHQLICLGEALKVMATDHATTVMVARTNSVDASPTTWGLHVSGYLTEISRHLVRLHELYPRAISGMYGGAVGNLASVGPKGIQVRDTLMHALGLNVPAGINNASQDAIVETVQFFALIHGTLCRLGNDVETMGRTPQGEVCEGEGEGSSSTMPNKSNPRTSNMLQTLARMGWMYASGAPAMLDQRDVRSASARMLNWTVLPEASLTISSSLSRAHGLISSLKVNSLKMRQNFECSGYSVMAESLMMKLAEITGREKAYMTVKALLSQVSNTHSFRDIVYKDPEIARFLEREDISHVFEPLSYLGSNDQLIQEAVSAFDTVKKNFAFHEGQLDSVVQQD